MINAEVRMQLDDAAVGGKVKRQALGPDGQTTGKYDNNPYHNSVLYEVEFDDGQVREYSANVIAESMLAQIDLDGFTLKLMEGVVDHKVDHALAISKADKWVYNRHGRRHLCKTTTGWWLLVRWKDKNETWMKLSVIRHERVISDRNGQICHIQRYRRRGCFGLVGCMNPQEKKGHQCRLKDLNATNKAQVWDRDPYQHRTCKRA